MNCEYDKNGTCIYCGEDNSDCTPPCECISQPPIAYQQFVRGCLDNQIPVRYYAGRGFYKGPAAVTSNTICEDDIVFANRNAGGSSRLRRDSMGLNTILYPG